MEIREALQPVNASIGNMMSISYHLGLRWKEFEGEVGAIFWDASNLAGQLLHGEGYCLDIAQLALHTLYTGCDCSTQVIFGRF